MKQDFKSPAHVTIIAGLDTAVEGMLMFSDSDRNEQVLMWLTSVMIITNLLSQTSFPEPYRQEIAKTKDEVARKMLRTSFPNIPQALEQQIHAVATFIEHEVDINSTTYKQLPIAATE